MSETSVCSKEVNCVQSSSFERFTLHALESFLRGQKWADMMRPFFITNSPRFQHFNQLYSISQAKNVAEMDIQMHSVHIEFISFVEGELFKEITLMGLTEERFICLLDENLHIGDESVQRLYKELIVYRNFVDFGLMMQEKYMELYKPVSGTEKSVPKSDLTNSIYICRVLWDLENVQVNPSLGGIKTVMQLQDFLKEKGLMGTGIDTRITAFLNPFNKSTSKKTIEELNKASVELVCASSKREDADRKLGIRINQEMQLLNPALTTFVIISSDQDFRQHIQLLANAGYKVVIIHDATHESWRNTLEMHASQAFAWSQVVTVPHTETVVHHSPVLAKSSEENDALTAIIVRGRDDNGNSTDTCPLVEKMTNPPTTDANTNHTLNSKPKNNHQRNSNTKNATPKGLLEDPPWDPPHPHSSNTITANPTNNVNNNTNHTSYTNHRDPEREALAVGWRVAVCQRWSSAFGFLLVDIAHPAVSADFSLASTQELKSPHIRINRKKNIPTAMAAAAAAEEEKEEGTKSGYSEQMVVKVYAHNSVLSHKPQAARILRAGEYVLAFIELDSKGPRATIVKDLFSSTNVSSTIE